MGLGMKIVFYSHDDSIEKMVNSLGGELFFVREDQDVLKILEDVDEDEDCLLFLDMDIGQKPVEAFNKSLVKNEWLYRIIISGSMKVKEFKKHQKGKTSAHGYVLKPFTTSVFKGILNDMEIGHLISEGELFQEGLSLPELPSEPQGVTGWSQDSDENAYTDDEDDSDFNAQEFKMNTQVRKLVDLHSVKGDRPPYEGELNSKIQKKFDEVFGVDPNAVMGKSSESLTNESIDLRQHAVSDGDGPEFDLSLGEEATELSFNNDNDNDNESTDDSILLDDSTLALDDDDDDDDLGESLDSGGIDLDLAEELGIDIEEEIDLGEELNFENDEPEQFSGDEIESLSEIDLEAAESSGESADFSRELDELTANRELPSKEELSEFDEETGDMALPDGEELQSISAASDEGSPMGQDNNDEFDLEVEELEEEDVLQFDDDQNQGDQGEDEGELSFSNENDSQEVGRKETEEDGELDFSLGDPEDSNEDNSDLSFDEEDDDALSDFDLGDDAALVPEDKEEDDSGSLDFSMGDENESLSIEKPTESSSEQESAGTSTSSFSGDDLAFQDDEDEDEIEKTMAINIGDINKSDLSVDSASDDKENSIETIDEEIGNDVNESDLEQGSEDLSFGDEEDEDDFSTELDDIPIKDETNPTMVMTGEMTQDLESMLDDDISTKEFRPGNEESELLDGADFDEELDFGEEEETQVDIDITTSDDLDDDMDIDLRAEFESEEAGTPNTKNTEKDEFRKREPEGHLSITAEADRVPPSFNESEAIRLQATIRQLREEREELLKEISTTNREKKLTDQDNLGLKAELDEAKIEISILKKRHSNEVDEMKYRLRLSDEKKLFSEEKARKLQKEFDRLQQKVRIDFNQIKQREKELESQLELVKMDSEGQVQSRDKKILDLKRKIDQLEFNMENIVIREQKSRDDKMRVEERLERIMKTLRGSIEVLEDDIDWQDDKRK